LRLRFLNQLMIASIDGPPVEYTVKARVVS
jgi:hypothetical protein